MVYEDDDGNRQEEPACPRCVSRFSWTEEQKAVIDEVLGLHYMFEEYEVAVWHTLTSQYGNSDYWPMREVNALREAVEASLGPCGLAFDQLRAVRGSLHVALAAEVLEARQRTLVFEIIDLLASFGCHLHNCHRDLDGVRIPREILEQGSKPKYLGCFRLEDALRLAPKAVGKSVEEIADLLREDVAGLLGELKSKAPQCHGGRSSRRSILERGIWNAVTVIEAKAADWTKRLREADECAEVTYVAGEIHDQIFMIDELIGMDCFSHDSRDDTIGTGRFLEAIEKIRPLIDWDECEHLRNWMDRDPATKAEREGDHTRSDSGTSSDQDIGELW
ncbi:MAG: hypothetical protein ACYSVY_04435 [Planctomycetota bacterium]|jgi:hypothetical protein